MTDELGERFEQANEATQMKLSVLSRYIGYRKDGKIGGGFLNATVRALARNYIDGHASFGEDQVQGHPRRNGTPLIAFDARVELNDGRVSEFTHLWFVEIDRERAEELARRVAERPRPERADVICGDINLRIGEILDEIHPLAPTLCVLDPYDPNDLVFTTIRSIATHDQQLRRNKIELFVNLPIGLQRRQARVAGTTTLKPGVVANLTALLGNERWLPALEEWARDERPWRSAYLAMRESFVDELKALGYRHFWVMDVPPNNPMYALVFATDNAAADKIMKSAMADWEKDPANPQQTLFG